MSDTNQVKLGIIEETTFDTIPGSPAFQLLNYTGSPRLGAENRHVTSQVIRTDRNVQQAIHVDREVNGDVNFELGFSYMDIPIEGALQNDWTVQNTLVNTGSGTPISGIVADGDIITCGASHGFVIYGLVLTTGFTNSENNSATGDGGGGLFYIEAADGTTITIDASLADETPPTGARIRNVGFQGASSDITATATGLGSTLLDFTTFDIDVGDWVYVGGGTGYAFATAACNGWCRVSAISANALTFDIVEGTLASTDVGADKTIRVFLGDSIANGTTSKSYTVQQEFDDHVAGTGVDTYAAYSGCRISTLSFDIPSADIVKGSFSFMGATAKVDNTGETSQSQTAAVTDDIFSTSSDVGSLSYNVSSTLTEVGTPNYVLSSSISVSNNLRRQTAVGTLGVIGIGSGKCDVTGNLHTYFGSSTFVAYAFADTELGYTVRFEDDDNQMFLIDIPTLKLTGGAPDVSGPDADVTVDLPFIATYNSTMGYTIKIQQFHYVP